MRALVLGSRRRERDSLAAALTSAGARVRVERGFDEYRRAVVEDTVVLDVADPVQVIDAARGCHILYHVARPGDGVRGSAIARSLMRVARESDVTRVFVISDAMTLATHGRHVTSRDRGVPGEGRGDEFEGLYALERGIARAASDGLHASVLIPGYVWHEGEHNAIPRSGGDSGRLTVVSATCLNAAAIAMGRRARAGARYTLGGVRTRVGEWRSWLEGRGERGGDDVFQLAAASGNRWLSGEDTERDLRVGSPRSLGDLTRGS